MPHKFCISFEELLRSSYLVLENKNDRSNRAWILNSQNAGPNSYNSCPVIFQNWVTIWNTINIVLGWKGHRFCWGFGFLWVCVDMHEYELNDIGPSVWSSSTVVVTTVFCFCTVINNSSVSAFNSSPRRIQTVSDITHPELTGCGSCRVLDHSLNNSLQKTLRLPALKWSCWWYDGI